MQLFHSGDPFLHPRIFDMILAAASKYIYAMINTNGTFLDKKKSVLFWIQGYTPYLFHLTHFIKKRVNLFVSGQIMKNNTEKAVTIIEIVEKLDTS